MPDLCQIFAAKPFFAKLGASGLDEALVAFENEWA
jgi:hypothetical protein